MESNQDTLENLDDVSVEELNLVKEDMLNCLREVFIENRGDPVAVNILKMKAIINLLRKVKRAKIDLYLLKKTLIGKVISTVEDRVAKFRAKNGGIDEGDQELIDCCLKLSLGVREGRASREASSLQLVRDVLCESTT